MISIHNFKSIDDDLPYDDYVFRSIVNDLFPTHTSNLRGQKTISPLLISLGISSSYQSTIYLLCRKMGSDFDGRKFINRRFLSLR